MKTGSNTKVIILVVAGVAVGGLILFLAAFAIVFGLMNRNARNNDALTREQLANYEELSGTHAHFANDSIISMLRDESAYTPIDGIDYSSADIRAAFDDYYGAVDSAVSVVTSDSTMYNGDIQPQAVSKRDDGYNPDAPHPAVYAGGVDIRQQGRGDLFDVDDLDNPDLWLGMGDIISDYAEEGTGDGYGEWNDPDFWQLFAEYIRDHVVAELIASGYDVDSDALRGVIGSTLVEYAGEEWGDDVYWGGLGDAVDEYIIDEWSEPMVIPTPGIDDEDVPAPYDPGYDMDEINYKTTGRLHYREALPAHQQRAYDVLATAMQRGNFFIEHYEFGIMEEEVRPVVEAVIWDHPEFSFVRGDTHGPADGPITMIEILLDDDVMQMGIDKLLREVAERAAPVINAASKLSSDIDKMKYIVDYLCDVNEYSTDPSNCKFSQSMYSAIVTNETVCAGYATAFHYYMNALNIDATRISSCDHLWNMVRLDGEYYYMDVTWIDAPCWKEINGTSVLVDTSYEWFNFNETVAREFAEKTTSRSHSRDYLSILLPAANGTKYSYDNWYGSGEPEPERPRIEEISLFAEEANEADVADGDWSDPGHGEDYGDGEATVVINGVDVSDSLEIVQIDGVYFAEGNAFVESIRDAGMPKDMRLYSYDYTSDDDEIYDYLAYWFGPDGGNYLDESMIHLTECDAVIVNSWFTDSIAYIFFVDSPYAFAFSDMDELTKWTLDDVPRLINGECYLPMKEFSDVMGFELSLD